MTTVSRLALVSKTDSRWREYDTSVVPKWDSKMSGDATPLSDEEKERIERMNDNARFSATVVLDNFDARVGLFLPPTGYAAVWHMDVNFNAHVFDQNLFRGVAGIGTSIRKPPLDVHSIFADLNAVLGDLSPVPMRRDGPDSWVASLGAFGWVGLYHSSVHANAGLMAVVVSGLDDAAYGELREEMRKMHGRVSVGDAFMALEHWRTLAARNRRRVLSTFLRVLGAEPGAGSEKTSVEMREATYASRAATKIDAAPGWFNRVRVPEWFVFPSRVPAHCAPIPEGLTEKTGLRVDVPSNRETYPVECVPDFDVVLDDLAYLREKECVRLAGCAHTQGEHAASVRGPLDEIFIFKNATKVNTGTHDAVPAQAPQRVHKIVASVVVGEDDVAATWEDPALERNRNIDSTYEFRTLKRAGGGASPTVLAPYFVRVSCRDSTARAEPEKNLTGKRLACLAQDDYVPIAR